MNHKINKQAEVDHKTILIRTELVAKEKTLKPKDLKAQSFKPLKLKIIHLLYMRKSYTSLEDMMVRRTIATCEYSIQSKTAGRDLLNPVAHHHKEEMVIQPLLSVSNIIFLCSSCFYL